MFSSKKKKKTSFEPEYPRIQPDDDGELMIHEQDEHFQQHHTPHRITPSVPMSRSNPQQILNSLALSSNQFAAGIALCVKALADATAGPPTSPIMVEYRSRRMAFGRMHLARLSGHEAVRMVTRTIYPQGNIPDSQRFIVDARLFAEDGQIARRDVGIDLESWEELLPYIHTLFVTIEPTGSGRDRDRDRDRERERERERDKERPRRGSHSAANPGPERREDPRDRDRNRHDVYAAEPVGIERVGSQNEGYSAPES